MKFNGAGIIKMYCLFKGQNTDKEHESELHINKEHTIIIPYYQRPSRWTESYIQDLFDDYNANFQKEKKHSEYFVGATVAHGCATIKPKFFGSLTAGTLITVKPSKLPITPCSRISALTSVFRIISGDFFIRR